MTRRRGTDRRDRAARVAGLLCALLGAAVPAGRGDVVQTRSERIAGKVTFRDGALAVGNRAVAFEDVLFAVIDRKGGTFRQPNTVRTTTGEVWHCGIVSLAAGKLTVRSPLLGTKQVPKSRVRAMEFQAHLPDEARLAENVLYRRAGEPLPGSILWISPTQVAVDSPLGAMAMDRDGLTRLILSKDARLAAPEGETQVVLADGTVLAGAATVAPGKLAMSHEVLGELSLPAGAVRSILRHPAGVAYLAELPLQAISAPLFGSASAGTVRTVDRHPSGRTRAPGGFIRSLTIQPNTTVTFRLPARLGADKIFRASVAAAPGAKGGVRLRVLAGGRAVLEKVLAPAAASEPISVALGRADTVAIEVAFADEAVRFPCGAVLGDAHVVGK